MTALTLSPIRADSPRSPAQRRGIRAVLGLLVAICAALPLTAQDVVLAPPADPLLAPHVRKQAAPPPLSRPPALTESPFKAGPLVFSPRLSYRHLSADGLPAADGRRVASEIRTVTPGLMVDLGENWSLDYSPTWVSYTARGLTDTTNHAARLSGGLVLQDWSFDFGQSYSESNSILFETAQQTAQKSWATTFGSAYRHSTKLQLQFSGSLNERYTSAAPDLKTWAGQAALNYLLTSQLSLNVGPTFSYTEVADGPDYYGESFSAGINWNPSERLTIALGGGVEYTHSQSASGQDLSNPLLNLSLSYQPFETTTLSASVARTVSSSYFRAQATENLRWSLNLSQRLLGKLYLGASYSLQESDYATLQSNILADRSDEIENYSVRLSTRMLQRLSVSLVWQKSKNTSDLAAFSFSSSQCGIELGYRY